MIVKVQSAQLCTLCNRRLLNHRPLALVVKCQHLFHKHCIDKSIPKKIIQDISCPFLGCKKKITPKHLNGKLDYDAASVRINPKIYEDKPIFEDPAKIKRWIYVGATALSILAFGIVSSTGTFLMMSGACGLSAYLMGRSVDWYFHV